jgi:hypothetical protein
MLGAVVMVAGVIVGLACGVCLSVFVFRQTSVPILWPVIAMSAFAPFTLLGAIMIAYLTGGICEEALGTAWGPTIGVFAGCLIGSFILNSLFGSLGLLGWAVVRLAQGQTDEEGRPRL